MGQIHIVLRRYHKKFLGCLEWLRDPFLLFVRLYWGWQFAQAGWGKFQNFENVVGFFTNLGIPFPELNALIVAATETVGGTFLLVGMASRLASIPLAVSMFVAYLTAHTEGLSAFFTDPSLFIKQAPFSFLMASIIVLIFGPGKFAADRLIANKYAADQDGE